MILVFKTNDDAVVHFRRIIMRHFDIFFTSDNEILSGLPGAAAVSLCGEEGREGKAANPSMSIAKMCHY